MACSILALATLSSHTQQSPSFPGVNLLGQSNSYASPLIAQSSGHSEQNNVPATKVEARWRNAAEPKAGWIATRSTSAAAQVIQFYTNKLIR